MIDHIARFLEPLLRIVVPGTGRRRRGAVAPVGNSCRPEEPTPRQFGAPPLRGEDHALVRPYLVAHERQEEARRQRARRRTLWLAVHGIDVGPRVIHGVEVTV